MLLLFSAIPEWNMCFISHIWQYVHPKMKFLLWNLKLVWDVLQPPLKLNDKVFYHFIKGFSLKTSLVVTKISPKARDVLTRKKQSVAHLVDDDLLVWFSGGIVSEAKLQKLFRCHTRELRDPLIADASLWISLYSRVVKIKGNTRSNSCFLNIKAIIDHLNVNRFLQCCCHTSLLLFTF